MGDPNGTLRVLMAMVFAGIASMVWGMTAVLSALVLGSHDLFTTGNGSFALGLQVAMVAVMAETVLFPWR